MRRLTITKKVKINLTTNHSKMRRAFKAAVEVLRQYDPVSVLWFKHHYDPGYVVSGQVRYMLKDLEWVDSEEFRLNNAGFKFYMGPRLDGSVWGYVGGDQRESHPEAYLIISILLLNEGILDPDRATGETDPLTNSWWKAHSNRLAPWCIKWLRENVGLVPEVLRKQMRTGICSW